MTLRSTVGDVPYAQHVDLTTAHGHYAFMLPLIGEFQATNAATAILACEQVRSVLPTNATNAIRQAYSAFGVVSGLAIGQTYWLDIDLASVGAGTSSIFDNNIIAIEF